LLILQRGRKGAVVATVLQLSWLVSQASKFVQQTTSLHGCTSKHPVTEFKLKGYNLFWKQWHRYVAMSSANIYMFELQLITPLLHEEQLQQQAAAADSSGGWRERR
jgi:hypothetical protein